MNARKEAFNILKQTIKESGYSNLLLRNRLKNYSDVDKSFITNLVYGCLDNYETLKFQLNGYFDKTNFDNELLFIMSLYERFYLNKDMYITVNEYVNLSDNEYDKSFINAVLHKIDSFKEPNEDYIKHNLPKWIYNLLFKQYSQEELNNILTAYRQNKNIYYHINKNKCSFDDLNKFNINIINDYFFTSKDNLLSSKEFEDGYFYVQDINSSKMVMELDLNKDDIFLDACSAPGSKLFNALDYIDPLNAYSNDISEKRVNLIFNKANILGFKGIHFSSYDARELSNHFDFKFNKILLDVPCSGLGVISRRPDIKFHIKDTSLDELELIQKDILNDASKLLCKGGLLCYSTCTLNKKENSKQVHNFIDKNESFILIKEETIINNIGDMFYYAIIKRL